MKHWKTCTTVVATIAVVLGGGHLMAVQPVSAPDFVRVMMIVDERTIWGALPTIGMAEHAARMGSISKYERRGSIAFVDEFQNGLSAWSSDTSGTGAAVELTNLDLLDGSYGAKFTTGSDDFLQAAIYKYFALLDLGYPMGLELAYKWAANAGDYMYFSLVMYDGTTRYSYTVKIERATGKLYVQVEPATYVEFADLGVSQAAGFFYHRCKLVIDPTAKTYLRFYYDEIEYDLSAYVPNEVTQATPTRIKMQVYFLGTAAANDAATVNHIILTTNEPDE